jgi:KTSC domain
MTNVNLVETLSVESSAISEVSYFPNVERLFVQFKNGREYEFFNVPIHVMNGLREAPSKGKFLNKYVLAFYRFKKS